MTDLNRPPEQPICKAADGYTPCRYAGKCSARRQRMAAGIVMRFGQEVIDLKLVTRGMACTWFQRFVEREPDPRPAA